MNEPNEDRIERAIEGLLPDGELEALKADVIRDPEVRAAYVERVWLHSTLRAERESLVGILEEPAAENKIVRRWPFAVWAAAAAACVTLIASVAALGTGTLFHRPVATLVQADNCKWAGSDLPTAVNSKLGAGTLALVEGIATLKFKSGAMVTIEAPTKLQIRDAMHCRLLEGSLVAEVPEPAHGFTIDTADMKVIDLGTKFGLTAGSAGNSQVCVFEGEVEVGGVGPGMKRLQKGKGINIGSGNLPMDQEPRRAQAVQEEGGWTAITTAFGRGKDAYARRGENPPTGAHPLVMVKHSDDRAGQEQRAARGAQLRRVGSKVGEYRRGAN